ncbi:MAG: hypothetical protein WBM24_24475 [Candidatus Sulfotelmatobacter sp.]
MSVMQTALRDVGYKPTKGEREMVAHNLEIIRLAELNKPRRNFANVAFGGGVVEPLIKPRKIQFERCGSHVRARYQGERTFVIGVDKREATSRLKT